MAEFIHRGVQIAKDINGSGIGKKLADFKTALKAQEWPAIGALRSDVEGFAAQVGPGAAGDRTRPCRCWRRPNSALPLLPPPTCRRRVSAAQFPTIGFSEESMRYP